VGLVAFVPTTEVVPIYQQTDFDDLHVPPYAPPSGDERIIIVEKIDAEENVEKDRNGDDIQRRIIGDEAEEILADPSKLFQKLKSGRFRVWLQDGAEAERNLIWDVILRDGKPEAGGEGNQRPPTELPAEPVPAVPPEAADPAADAAALDGAAATGTDPATAEVPAAPASSDTETADGPVDLDAEGSAAGAAAVGALALPAALRRVAVHGRQMVRHVRSGVSALLRSISP
jgi:hypothetical protein